MVALQLDRMMTEETKKKLSQALKGRKLTEEHKRNISKAKKGTKFTEEHERNISKAKKGFSGKGIPKSESHILKLKKAQQLRRAKERSRAIWSIRSRIQLPEYYSNST